MATFDSPATSYSDTTPHKRAITDAISLIDPSDIPAVELFGGLDGAMGKFRLVNWPHTKVEWLEDTLAPLTGTLSTSASSDTTAISVADASVFQEGHILLIDSEQVWVSAVALATELVTITRNYGGTQATHQSSSTITIVGMARLEGDDTDDLAFTDRSAPYNYTQIFHRDIKVSRTQNQLSQYGIGEEFEYQSAKAVPELGRLLERQLYYGVRGSGSASTPRAFGGFSTFVTDNLVSGSTLAQSQFEAAVQAAYSDGGSGPWVAFCSPSNLLTIKGFYDSSNFLRVDRSESTLGMVIEDILTPFGSVSLALDRWATDTEIWIIDPKHAGFLTYYPFTQEELAKTGDSMNGEVIGEFTFCLRQDKAHAALTNVS